MIYMKKIVLLIIILTAVVGCDKGDDLQEIFQNRKWTLSFFREGSYINSIKGDYRIQFHENVFTATTPRGVLIEGYWEADNKKKSFRCRQVKITSGNIAGDTTALKMKSFLENATSYEGDANVLKIRELPNKYMQFHNKY